MKTGEGFVQKIDRVQAAESGVECLNLLFTDDLMAEWPFIGITTTLSST